MLFEFVRTHVSSDVQRYFSPLKPECRVIFAAWDEKVYAAVYHYEDSPSATGKLRCAWGEWDIDHPIESTRNVMATGTLLELPRRVDENTLLCIIIKKIKSECLKQLVDPKQETPYPGPSALVDIENGEP